MSLNKRITLNTGAKIPQLGFGTWQSAPGEVGDAVYEACKVGYRHLYKQLLTIFSYENQQEIAEGLKRAFKEIPGLKREDLFITSKLWNSQHRSDLVEPALDACLKELGLDYLDLYLVHFPVAFKSGRGYNPVAQESSMEGGEADIDNDVSIVETWRAMTNLPKSKARAVGVSNHMIPHLDAIIKATGITPAVNQIERHPCLQSDQLVEYCAKNGIHITSYSAFGNNMIGVPLVITRPEIQAVAQKVSVRLGRDVTPAQVVLAWSQVGGHSVIPKSVTASRIAQNFQELELLDEEIEEINQLGQSPQRFNVPFVANSPRWNINIFNEDSEKAAKYSINLKA
ncbi:unnamed protein product [Penicillium olsonii]|nr:unnamed protein product [Penicillium olsonii]